MALSPRQIEDLRDYGRDLVDCDVLEKWRLRKAIVRRAHDLANPHLDDRDKERLEEFLRDLELWDADQAFEQNLDPNADNR